MLVARIPQPATARTGDPELLKARELGPATVLLSVVGDLDVDAAVAPALFDRITHLMQGHHQLVLDLSRVAFFGTAGLSLLHRLNVLCTRAAVDWALVTGPEVQRLLRVCDPDGSFPVATNIVSAVATLARGPHRTPQLRLLH